MTRTLILAALWLGLTPLASALTDGWNSDVEHGYRQWTKATLDWATAIHPEAPLATDLVDEVVPPPREMWCVDPQEWEQYCEAWEFSMTQWLHHYLDIHYDDPLPTNLPPFPKECPSACDVY